jgi:cell fate (sporulation/competence/biofilm development) regulator YlbF (YheA/YmcA/DUF963 family)
MSKKIEDLSAQLHSMKGQLEKYQTLFAVDGIIDTWEQKQLDAMFSMINKCESKLDSLSPQQQNSSGFKEFYNKVIELQKRINALKTAIKPVIL